MGNAKTRSRISPLQLLWVVPTGLVIAAVFLAPVWALATVMEYRFGSSGDDAEQRIRIGAIILAIGLTGLIVHATRWSMKGRPENSFIEYHGGIAFWVGGIATAVALGRGLGGEVPGLGLWLAPYLLSTVVGLVVWVTALLARARAKSAVVSAAS